MNKPTKLALLLPAAALFLAGCLHGPQQSSSGQLTPSTSTSPQGQSQQGTQSEPTSIDGITLKGRQLATNYHEFTQEDYDALRAAGRPVLLHFYADWCPVCRAEEPAITSTFNRLGTSNQVVGLRVNFKDGTTDRDEQQLARDFDVPYQYTTISIAPDGTELWRTTQPLSEKTLEKALNDLAASI